MKKYKVILAMIFVFLIMMSIGYCNAQVSWQEFQEAITSQETWVSIQGNEVTSSMNTSNEVPSLYGMANEGWDTTHNDFVDNSFDNGAGGYGACMVLDGLTGVSSPGEIPVDTYNNIATALNARFGPGNWNICFEQSAGFSLTETNATGIENAHLSVQVGNYGRIRNFQHNYRVGSTHLGSAETHLSAVLNPDRRGLAGKESLYMLGDYIRISGNHCTDIWEHYRYCYFHTWEVDHGHFEDEGGFKPIRNSNGLIIGRKWEPRYVWHPNWQAQSGSGCGSSGWVVTGHGGKISSINVSFRGFKVGPNKLTSLPTFEGGTLSSISDGKKYNTNKLQITEIDNTLYDKDKGAYYGEIIVKSIGCCRGCSKVFRIYFGERTQDKIVELTVKVTPKSSGTATVTGYMDTNNDGKVENTIQSINITDEKTLKVVAGNQYEIKSTASNGYVYKWIVTPDGNVISSNNPYDYVMPSVNSKIVVHFTPEKADGYNLYITSNEGGRAWTDDRPSGTSYDPIPTKLGNKEVVMEKISGVKAGTEFNLKYEAEEGYEFDRWEYRPFVKETFEDKIAKIAMPHSDLTATAIFKKKPVVVTDRNPILKVTVNNEEWGEAYAIVNGVEVSLSEVNPNEEYKIVFEAKEGYYFTNWDYDTEESPFIDADNGIIVMPNYDVEITAFFAPVPPKDEPARSGDVKFVAETLTPQDGIIPGTVPEDLKDIAAGAEVTFGVTANNGYEFLYWYFTDTKGHIITPDNEYTKYGSGRFIMPDYDIIAHAVFKKVDTKSLEVRIEGNGKVENDGENIPSGTVIAVPTGDTIELIATPEEGWKFLHWKDEDGNILSEDEVFRYRVDEDKVIIAVFVQKNKYTLYVSSMNGGEAWTDGNENHPKESIIEKTDALGKTVYIIKDVYEGEKFNISYSVTEDGYTFNKWEYKPYIKADSEYNAKDKKSGVIEITMPNSDLTVTAVFKNNDVALEPELRVTSNNAEWGTAHTIIGGEPTKMDKTYNATIGENYDLYYEAKPGYYFVNWVYSTTKSPFVSENKIEMPDKNLEVMALFSPIPEPVIPPEDGAEKHSVDFTAKPPEGGSVPEDLIGDKEIYAGSKVTIGVTPNEGWEFDYWYFTDKDGNEIDVEVHFDPDGSGYFIMPDEDVIAIAVFKKAGRYILYVTYTAGGNAWVIDAMDGNKKTTRIDEAIAEKIYDIDYKVEDGYKFVGWEFRWDKYGVNPPEGVQPDIYKDKNKAVMPYSDMTVTAKFEKINDTGDYKLRVISNNYIWGNAWLKVDGKEYCWREIINGKIQQNANGEPGIMLEAGKDYEVYYKAEDGYIFTNWLPDEFFIHREFTDKEGYGIINIPKEYLKDIDLTAYFKPSPEEESLELTVIAEPSDAGTVSGGESDIKAGEPFCVNVEKVNSGYKFKYWYYYNLKGKKIKVTNEEVYEGRMPNHNLELIAHFDSIGGGKEPPEDPDPEDKTEYYIIVKIEGSGQVTDNSGSRFYDNDKREMQDGESIELNAQAASNYNFTGWMVKGKMVSTDPRSTFTIDGESIVVTACFTEKLKGVEDGFKIISVRDLRWKDYFVNGSSPTGNVFRVPQEDTMLKEINEYPDVLKMGYAVEFELPTSQLKPEKTVLVIKPTIVEKDWKDMKEGNGKIIDDSFKQIVIYGDGSPNEYTSKYLTKVSTGNSYSNNGIDINKILWNWVYYLPGDTYSDGYKNDITIRFNIELHETSDGRTWNKNTLKQNYVLFEREYSGVKWEGDVYKYSMTKSLFDDIYDNATN